MLLVIESSAKWPSVCLVDIDGTTYMHQRADVERCHAEKLPVFIDRCLSFLREQERLLTGVAVNAGPGSYTGLRIGLSLAKGLCYGFDVPLIGINGLEGMISWTLGELGSGKDIYAMIDARRDEVYAQVYLPEVGFSSTQALCLNKDTWVVHDTERSVFIGDACEKAQQLLQVNAVMCFDGPDAQQLAVLAHTKFARKEFESVAYFEPVYLKEFEPGISKKFIL